MDKIYSIWLQQAKLNQKIKAKLYEEFGDFKSIYEANEKYYKQVGLNSDCIHQLQSEKASLERAKEIGQECEQKGIRVIDQMDKEYPNYLKQISDAPMALYSIGNSSCLNKPIIAIVGARKCSEYGFEYAKYLAKELGKKGIIVASGMASGIDEAAHKGALEVGSTVAVLGTSITKCYPAHNYSLYCNIPTKGCVISEYYEDTSLPYQFVRRNRIISGIAMGVVVVEAALKSGSLITANLALEQNREVFAVPGNVTSGLSMGTNKLIQNGAKLVMGVEDILEELEQYGIQIKQEKQLTLEDYNKILAKDEIIVYDCLSWEPIYMEEIYSKIKWEATIVNTLLIKLQIKGLIQRLPGNRYVRTN